MKLAGLLSGVEEERTSLRHIFLHHFLPPPVLSVPASMLTTDGFIWCSTCGKEEYNGCEKHVTYFGDSKEFKLMVEKSSVGEKAGEGVVNRGKVIPEGVLFGPYSGKFIHAADYEKIKEAGMESGNGWEILDQFNMKTVGYVDPGVNPDPITRPDLLQGHQGHPRGQGVTRVVRHCLCRGDGDRHGHCGQVQGGRRSYRGGS